MLPFRPFRNISLNTFPDNVSGYAKNFKCKSFFFISTVLIISVLLLTFKDVTAASDHSTRAVPSYVTSTVSGQVDMCLSCHNEKPDKAHGRDVLGCFVCHRGNPIAGNKDRAHRGMIKNPGEFSVVSKTCGISGCHPDEVERTRKSLMATNRGVISTLRYYWGETSNRNENITIDIIKREHIKTPAVDYYRKLCGTCHTGMEKGKFEGFLAEKGGGCTACHATKPKGKDAGKGIYHVRMVKAVPSDQCIRCHNRSGRIGLTYQGKYESEGYGTPYDEGELSGNLLQDGRFVQNLPPDVHYSKANMACADCHTQKEIMGDGKNHAHLEEQLEVRCTTCHTDTTELKKLSEISQIPYSSWKRQINNSPVPRLNIKGKNSRYFLKRLDDNKLLTLNPPSEQCVKPVHKRVSCISCHSTWVPQCYGCHVLYDKGAKQLDKIAFKETPGKWTEFKSFVRFNAPPLGIIEQQNHKGKVSLTENNNGQVVILVPG